MKIGDKVRINSIDILLKYHNNIPIDDLHKFAGKKVTVSKVNYNIRDSIKLKEDRYDWN